MVVVGKGHCRGDRVQNLAHSCFFVVRCAEGGAIYAHGRLQTFLAHSLTLLAVHQARIPLATTCVCAVQPKVEQTPLAPCLASPPLDFHVVTSNLALIKVVYNPHRRQHEKPCARIHCFHAAMKVHVLAVAVIGGISAPIK